jgi:transcriptional regulator with XRE-family HTH domain
MDLPDLTERLADYTRILRRRADASQREMAALTAISPATISGLESGRVKDVRLRTYAQVARAGGCRMVLIDMQGAFVQPYPGEFALLDAAGRRLPAHLDPRKWIPPICYWTPPHGELTFDRDRAERDRRREE